MNEILTKYLKILNSNPELINNDAPLEIVTDLNQINKHDGEIGILFQDRFITLIRDLVKFPSGRLGAYNRIINTAALGKGGASAVVLPVNDGKILLIRIFRHPIQQWSIEIPRGFGEPGLSPLALAEKEVNEEVEGKINQVIELGILHSNTGLEGNDIHLFYAELEEVGKPSREEGIDEILWVSISELEQMIVNGEITDSFTISTYTRAKLKGLI